MLMYLKSTQQGWSVAPLPPSNYVDNVILEEPSWLWVGVCGGGGGGGFQI